MLRHAATAVFLLAALAARPSFADVTGEATVVDGNILVVARRAGPAAGHDAPELHRLRAGVGVRTDLGGVADGPPGRPRQVECVGHACDRYGRLLAVCYVGGENLNERIVREGWALDFWRYSTDYLQAESAAKRGGAGIWRGQFTPPWEWRAARR